MAKQDDSTLYIFRYDISLSTACVSRHTLIAIGFVYPGDLNRYTVFLLRLRKQTNKKLGPQTLEIGSSNCW